MKLPRSFFFGCVFVSLISGCKTVHSQSSATKHDEGRFLNSTDLSLWGNFTEEEYQKLQVKKSTSKMLPIDHELTKRLQFWADAIRVKMIEVMPQVASVPAPKIRILKSDTVNAYAQSMKVTLAADIAAPLTDPSSASSTETVSALGQDCSNLCFEFRGDIEAKRKLVEVGQRRLNPDCRVQAGNEALQISESCLAAPGSPYSGPRRFNRYNTAQVMNYISVLSEAIKVMSESDMVVTLAHELGHYYLAHPVFLQFPDPSVPYDYLYLKSENKGNGKPKPLSPNDPDWALVKEFDQAIDFSFPVFEGQKYSTALDLALARSVSDGLSRGKIADRCITDTDVQLCLKWGYEVTTPALALTNWEFNSKADFFSAASVAKGKDLALKFEEALAKHGPILRASDVSNLQEILAKYVGGAAPVVKLSGDKDETLASFLPSYVASAQIAIDNNPRVIARLTQTLFDKGLGFYTAEQEADDVATEILYELGFTPDLIIQNWLKFLDRSTESQSLKEGCKANYASGFKSPVWIGLSTEPHHGNCYRAYNAYKEIEAHRDFFEKHKAGQKPTAPGGSWDDLVAAMKGKSFIDISAK